MEKMKYIINSLIICCLISIISCNQDSNSDDENIIAVSIKNSEIYEYQTGISGDEEGVLIEKQASHFEISEIIRDSSTQWSAVYRYKPEQGYIGTDNVEIKTMQGSDGASPNTDIKIIKIEITITE